MSRWKLSDVEHLLKKPVAAKTKGRSRVRSPVYTPDAERLLGAGETEKQTQLRVIDALDRLNLVFYHINNGADIGAISGAIAQGQGVVAGVPDLCVCESFEFNGVVYHGLYVELKKPVGGKLSPKQEAWAAALRERGYWVISGIGGSSLVIDFILMVFKPRAQKPACMIRG